MLPSDCYMGGRTNRCSGLMHDVRKPMRVLLPAPAILVEVSGIAGNPFLGDELWEVGFCFRFGAQKWHALC